jgi:hypothetical protein
VIFIPRTKHETEYAEAASTTEAKNVPFSIKESEPCHGKLSGATSMSVALSSHTAPLLHKSGEANVTVTPPKVKNSVTSPSPLGPTDPSPIPLQMMSEPFEVSLNKISPVPSTEVNIVTPTPLINHSANNVTSAYADVATVALKASVVTSVSNII